MKLRAALVLAVSLGGAPALAEDPGGVRPLDPAAAEALAFGAAASPSFRALLSALECDGVVVHVVSGEMTVFGAFGSTRLAGAVGPWRYLRTVIDPGLPLDERTAVLAHELQHAREMVEAAVTTQRHVRQLYERIGMRVIVAGDTFETAAAVAAGSQVWRELQAWAAATSGSAALAAPGPERRLTVR